MHQFILPLSALLLSGACGRIGFDAKREAQDATPGQQDATPGQQDASDACLPPEGLLGHWTLNAADVVGTSVLDRSGNAYHGTLSGDPLPVVVAGSNEQALDYTATDRAFVDLPNIPVDSTPGAFNTVALWFFHPGPLVDEVPFYMPPGTGAAPPRYDLWLTDRSTESVSLCFNSGDGNCWGISSPELLGRWVHVVAVFANGRIDGSTLYVNGQPVPMSCVFGSCDVERVALNPITLGASDSTYAWHGRIDDVQLYGRALDAAEAAEIYACAQ